MTANVTPERSGLWLMAAGLVLLAASAGLMGYNLLYREKRAADNTEHVRARLQQEFILSEPLDADLREMQSVEIDGTAYVGTVEIPSLELSLPVARDFSYETLDSSVCRYAGSVLEQDMIIAGHNYRCHFKNIGTLAAGDAVTFTDVTGVEYSYAVAQVEIIPGTAADRLVWTEPGLTLFTCTYDGARRYVVRCTPEE